jgi:PH domain
MESIVPADIIKQGTLGKLGGGAGGHKNWKDRYFVLSDHLYYFTDKDSYIRAPTEPLGRVILDAYFCSKSEEESNNEFILSAYPKVRNHEISMTRHFDFFSPFPPLFFSL